MNLFAFAKGVPHTAGVGCKALNTSPNLPGAKTPLISVRKCQSCPASIDATSEAFSETVLFFKVSSI